MTSLSWPSMPMGATSATCRDWAAGSLTPAMGSRSRESAAYVVGNTYSTDMPGTGCSQ